MSDVSSVDQADAVDLMVEHREVGPPAAFSWSELLRFAGVGVVALALAVSGVAAGAIVSGWFTVHVEAASQHPVAIALLTTVATYAVLYRAIPWARLIGPLAPVAVDIDIDQALDEPGDVDLPRTGLAGLSAMRWRLTLGATSIATALVVHHNVLGHFSSQTIGDQGDREWYVYISWKIGEAFRHGTSPFHLTGLSAPFGYDVLRGDGFLPTFFGGFVNLFIGPTASYNLLLMVSTVLAVVAGLYLARRITPHRSVQLVTALAIATAPVMFVRFQGHLSLCFAFPLTLVVAEAVEIGRRGGRVRVVRLVIWLLLGFGSSIYFLLIAVGVLGVAVMLRCLSDVPERKAVLVRSVVALGVVGVLIAPIILQRIEFTNAELDGGSFFDSTFATDGIAYNADVLAEGLPTYPTLVNLPGTHKFLRNIVGDSGEGNFSFPGLLLITLGIGGLVALRTRGTMAVLISAGCLWVLTLGPVADVYGLGTVGLPGTDAPVQWLPFKLLGHLPMLSGLRAPGRLSLGLPPLLGVGLAFALHQCIVNSAAAGRLVSRRAGASMLAVAAVLVFNVPTFRTSPPAINSDAAATMLRSLKTLPGRVGRVAPVPSCQGVLVGTESSLQIWHGLESVGCQGQYLALPFASEMKAYRESPDLASLRCDPNILGYVQTGFPADHHTLSPDLADLRVGLGIRFLIINKGFLPTCPGVEAAVQTLRDRYTVIPGDDQWEAIDLDSPVAS